MKKTYLREILLSALLLASVSLSAGLAQHTDLNSGLGLLAKALKLNLTKTTHYVAVCNFPTSSGKSVELSSFITEELGRLLPPEISIIDQQRVNAALEEFRPDFEAQVKHKVITDLTMFIFMSTNHAPEAYIFGKIDDMEDYIKISVKMLDANSYEIISKADINIKADEITDRLLGKPAKMRTENGEGKI